MVNQLEHSEASETTPERQSILDSHIRARIKDEIELLKKNEEDIRWEIELALEKENLDHEKSLSSEGANSSILLGDVDEMRVRIDKYDSRRKSVDVEVGDAVVECYK